MAAVAFQRSACVSRGVFAFRAGGSQEASTSISDLDLEPGSETECRDRGLGGTMEDNTEECFLETPMMSAVSRTGDSSCPLWLRKVFLGSSQTKCVCERCRPVLICSHEVCKMARQPG